MASRKLLLSSLIRSSSSSSTSLLSSWPRGPFNRVVKYYSATTTTPASESDSSKPDDVRADVKAKKKKMVEDYGFEIYKETPRGFRNSILDEIRIRSIADTIDSEVYSINTAYQGGEFGPPRR
ncbi:hypothetical protein RIF29_17753 [Crotalaria pallida]|uniref:Uncharacterized protein n=1 Tax=Crotalaria pallida TaxID=3830 RepID=A0AAN9IGQ9_CROPI